MLKERIEIKRVDTWCPYCGATDRFEFLPDEIKKISTINVSGRIFHKYPCHACRRFEICEEPPND